jgi:hypothetical protein
MIADLLIVAAVLAALVTVYGFHQIYNHLYVHGVLMYLLMVAMYAMFGLFIFLPFYYTMSETVSRSVGVLFLFFYSFHMFNSIYRGIFIGRRP